MATTALHHSQPLVATVLAQFQSVPSYKIRHYAVISQKFLDNSTLCISVLRQELQKQFTNDYNTFENWAIEHPTQKAQWHLNRGWVNVPATIETEFVCGLLPLQTAQDLAEATTLVLSLGLFNPYGLLLNAQNELLAICLNPRIK